MGKFSRQQNNTPEPLYKTIPYKAISDIRWFKGRPQKFWIQHDNV